MLDTSGRGRVRGGEETGELRGSSRSRCRDGEEDPLTLPLTYPLPNGPGGASCVEDYSREIPKLNSYSNVKVLGYVRTDYCRRPVEDVEEDIETYGSWEPKFRPSGIFFDETPNLDSEDGSIARYLARVAMHTKACKGILGDRLVHAPFST